MTKFRALLWLEFRAMLTSFRMGSGKKKSRRPSSGMGPLVVLAAISLYVSGVYSFLFASQLANLGILHVLLLLMPVLAVAMSFFFSLFAAQGIVFGGKDNDIMLALPVSSFTLLLTRTLALYLENLVVCLFMMAPAGVAYLVFGGSGGALFLLLLLLCTLFLALLPTLLSLIVGFVLAWVSSKLTRKALISNLLYLVFFAVIFFGAFRLNTTLSSLMLGPGQAEAMFRGWGTHFLLVMEATCHGSLLSLLALAALCLVPFLAAVWLFSLRYKRIITGLTARGARSDYKLGRLTASGQRRALLGKEFRRFFGSPIYLFNTGLGLLFLIALGVAALVKRDFVSALVPLLDGLPIPLMAGGLLCMLATTVSMTSCTISLEGKQLWILKTAPVSVGTLFGIKLGFQLVLVLPCLLFAALCLSFSLSLAVWEGVLVFALAGCFALFDAVFGLLVNLRFPKLDAPNDAVAVKQSASALISIFGPMGLVLVCGVACYFLSALMGGTGTLILLCLLCALAAAAMLLLLRAKGRKLFAAL